jgi:uncharacterized OB-fold protein
MASTIGTRGLVTTVDGEQRLVGVRCDTCTTHAFPAQATCPRCGAPMSAVALPAAGTVWSWTVQRIRPKPPYVGPDDHEPFAVGYVDLGPVRVESRLEGKPPDAWRIDDPVRLAAGEPDEHGDVWSYRFVDARTAEAGGRS